MRQTRMGEIQDRFWQRVDKSDPSGCWNWIGVINKTGGGYGVIGGLLYGQRLAPKGHNLAAHRVSWIIANGSIPESSEYHGWVVMHKCDNPRCVNPAHLELGTQRANVHDMIAKKRDVRVRMIGTKHPRAVLTDAQVKEIRASDIGTVELAKHYNVSRSTVQDARYGRSYAEGAEAKELQAGPRVRTALKGSANPTAKLTDDQVREIRSSTLSAEKWAVILGVSAVTVGNARRRKTFQNIP